MTDSFFTQSYIVLGLSGKKGVGKNYISETYTIPQLCSKVREKYPDKTIIPYFFSFGSCIKAELYSRNVSFKLDDFLSNQPKTTEMRMLLQSYGTELGREQNHDKIWIRQIEYWMATQLIYLSRSPIRKHLIPLFVIQDIRFKNEYEYVSKLPNSIIIRIVSDERHSKTCQIEGTKDDHVSETDLDHHLFPYYIFNDSYHQPEEQSMDIITHVLESIAL